MTKQNSLRICLMCGLLWLAASHGRVATPAQPAQRVSAQEAFGRLPLYFVENRGQLDERVTYYLQGRERKLYFAPDGVTIVLSEAAAGGKRTRTQHADESQRWVVKLDFAGARRVQPVGEAPTQAVFSYFNGAPAQWRTGLRSYARLVYRDLWPGIDLVYAGTVSRMKYSFVVRPGANAGQIRLAYRGASSVRINASGELEIDTPAGGFNDERPVSVQLVNGQSVEIATQYRLESQADGATVYGFALGEYDRSRELVIDPAMLIYCGYLGGGTGASDGENLDASVAFDAAGNAYLTGSTQSDESNFPVAGGPDLIHNGGLDVFVAKVNAAGTALVYCGFLGGSNDDISHGIAVDSSGNAYLTGETASTQASFPVAIGPVLAHGGGFDGFVAKLNAAGTTLVYCGYVGGDGDDAGFGVAVDGGGNAYLAGNTSSAQASFPETAGPDLTYNDNTDGFVAKVNAMGTAFVYCGYLGGDGFDSAYGIALDGGGNAYVTGETTSNAATFPEAVGPDLTHNGDVDAFVAKVNAAGTALVYCGYLGGDGADFGYAIAVDSTGAAYLTGETTSSEASFPDLVGPDLSYNGGTDAFVAKVNATGNALVYCGYLGGDGADFGYAIALDGSNNAYLGGATNSAEASFPEAIGPDLTYNGGTDAFVAKVNAIGAALGYCGYLGGSGNESATGIAVESGGALYCAGFTDSTQASFPVTAGPDLTYNGGDADYFVARLNAAGTAFTYCGYLGGAGAANDLAQAIAADAAGNAYLTGVTAATEATFPETAGPDLSHNGNTDAFVAKVNQAGTALLYCGYLGGSGTDAGYGIAVDAAGNAYVTGETASTEKSFPVVGNLDPTQNGDVDAFAAKVNAAGTALVYCGYIGGDNADGGRGIALDGNGNAYLTGYTLSNEFSFPVLSGPDLSYNGGLDAFVAKVNASGAALIYCGYLGGDNDDGGRGIAVDGSGNAYLTGETASTAASFPVAVGPDLTQNGDVDAFVAKVNANGLALAFCGYLGGSAFDGGYGIAADGGGNAYLTGETASTEASFPETVGPDLSHNGGRDAFVAKVNTTGAALVYCGYIGGSGMDAGRGLALDSAGYTYLIGQTDSTQTSFPVSNAFDLTHNGGLDAFIARVQPSGASLRYCGYLGGSGADSGLGIALDAAGNAFVAGYTGSTQTSFPVSGGPDLTFNGGANTFDAFVAKLNEGCTFMIAPTMQSFGASGGSGSVTVTTQSDCVWAASEDLTWVTITAGASGAGNGAVNFTVAANSGPARNGVIVIAGQSFTVTQSSGCVYSLSPTMANFNAGSNAGSVAVNTSDAACAWTATSNAGWLTITAGVSGTGVGQVDYSVAANPGAARSGTLTIGGQTFTVNQDACMAISVAPAVLPPGTVNAAYSQTFTQANGTGGITWMLMGTPPTGLSFNAMSATLAGTPTQAGNFNLTVKATDSLGCIGMQSYTLTINCQTITVNPTTLPNGFGGVAYSQSFTQTGGVGAISWSQTGTLPTGLSFNAATATLAGTPTVTGSFNITIKATDANNCFGERAHTLTINACPTITLAPTTLPGGLVNTAYSQTLTASGGVAPHTFTVSSGALPAGITLSPMGELSGTPTQAGSFNLTIKATDTNGCAGTQSYTLVICAVITVNPASLPAGFATVAYNQTLSATGGTALYGFAVTAGALPGGLALSGAGALTGTPTATGSFNFTVTATDANNCAGTRAYALTINACATITLSPATLPAGQIGAAYNQTVTASGGTAPHTFSLSAGALPNGVTLSPAGVLAGTPTMSGSFPVTIKAVDANGCMGTQAYTLVIDPCPPITVNPSSLPNGLVGAAYNQTITATGGTAPYGFTVSAGALPGGLMLSAAGVLSGMPTASGSFSFTVRASDTNNCAGTRAYTLFVCAAITITPVALPQGFLNAAYNQPLAQTGGAGAIAWSVSGGALPGGLALNPNSGALSGTPTAQGSFNFTVRATDANGCFGERAYALGVSGAGLMFYPLPRPVRLLDTRAGFAGCDAPGAPIAGGTSRTQTIAGRTCEGISIPATARAVTGNVTTVQSGGGFLTLYPSDAAQPTVANSNYLANEVVNNVFTVGLGANDGAFKIFVTSTTEIVVDVTGYYAPPGTGGLFFHPLPRPIRLLDTRPGFVGCDAPGLPISSGDLGARTQLARRTCDGVTIPNSALAVVGNATVVNPGGGFMTLFPSDAPRPLAASSNYLAGQIVNAPFTVGLGGDGAFKIFVTTATHLVIDLLGYYSPEASDLNGAGLLFSPLPRPVRLLETRAGFVGCYTTNAPLQGGTTRTQTVRGVCDGVTIANDALGLVGNVTTVNPVGGFLTFWPSNATQPTIATSNYATGQVWNRHFTVGLGPVDGAFKIFPSGTTDLVVDASGYFAP